MWGFWGQEESVRPGARAGGASPPPRMFPGCAPFSPSLPRGWESGTLFGEAVLASPLAPLALLFPAGHLSPRVASVGPFGAVCDTAGVGEREQVFLPSAGLPAGSRAFSPTFERPAERGPAVAELAATCGPIPREVLGWEGIGGGLEDSW